jgi:hypothetical protein
MPKTNVLMSWYARGALIALVTALPACAERGQGEQVQGDETMGEEFEGPDSLGALTRAMNRNSRTYQRLSEEKDTLIATLETAMLLFNELSDVERDIVGAESERAEGELEAWDDRVRGQLQRLRTRYAELGQELERAEQRLRSLQSSERTMRESLTQALQTAAQLRADNERKQAMIDELSARVATLTTERDAAVALSQARSDTIVNLEVERNTVYWIAGTEEELKAMNVVQTVGGRQLVFTRVGETLARNPGADLGRFNVVDRRSTELIDIPDTGEYEVLTQQNFGYADQQTIRMDGQRRLVRGELRIRDPRFWDQAPVLILVRR